MMHKNMVMDPQRSITAHVDLVSTDANPRLSAANTKDIIMKNIPIDENAVAENVSALMYSLTPAITAMSPPIPIINNVTASNFKMLRHHNPKNNAENAMPSIASGIGSAKTFSVTATA